MATPLFGFTTTGSVTYSLQGTGDVTGLTIWIDSSDKASINLGTGSNVNAWSDKVNGVVFSNTSGSYPTQLSNTPGVNFANGGGCNGTVGLVYFNTWYLPTQNFSVFCVNNPTTSSMFNGSFGIASSTYSSARPGVFAIAQFGTQEDTLSALDFDGANPASYMESSGNGSVALGTIRVDEIVNTSSATTSGIWTNGVLNTYANAPDNYTSPYTNYPVDRTVIGASTAAWGLRAFTGNVYEAAIYNRAVTPTERTNLETYYRLKWMFAPTQYTSNVYWFDASDTSTITRSGSTVTAWANKGTASMTFAANTGTITTGTATKNNRNVISFPTSSKLVSAATILAITGNDETIFVVYQKRANIPTVNTGIDFMTPNNPNPGGNPNGFDLYYNGINNGNDLQTNTSNYDRLWTVAGGYCFTAQGNTPTYSPYEYQLLSLVVSQTSPGFWSFGGNNNGVGGGPGQRFAGCANGYRLDSMTFNMGNSTVDWDMAEYIVYNRVLTLSERQNVEGYLSIKWGITLVPSHPYSTQPAGASAFSPTSISGSILWLDAADTGAFTGGSTWTDKSGTGNTGINGTPGFSTMPSVTTWYNGRRAARFVAGSKNSVKTTNNTPSYNLTIFFVARIQAAVGYGFFFIDNYAGQRQVAMNTSSFPVSVLSSMNSSAAAVTIGSYSQGVPFIYSGTLDSSTHIGYSNGSQSGSSTVNSSTLASQYYFGSGNGDSGYLTIDVAEIIIYNTVLSTTNRQRVETYLINKWGIPK